MAKNSHLLPIVLLFGLIYAWFLTNGSFALFTRDSFGGVYDSLAQHFWHGSLEVDQKEIAPEAYRINGKTYAYFLPAPAVPRLFLNGLFPSLYGRWTRTSMLLAAFVTLWAGIALLRTVRPWFPAAGRSPTWERRSETLFAATLGLGSTLLFLSSRAYTYHEAIAWGSCLTLLTILWIARYLSKASALRWAAACVSAIAAFFSRPSSGAGALAAVGLTSGLLCMLLLRSGNSWWKPLRGLPDLAGLTRGQAKTHAAAGGAAILLAASLFAAYNHARFGTWLDSMPLRYYEQFSAARLNHVRGSFINAALLPTNLKAYWIYPELKSLPLFPWIGFSARWPLETGALPYDGIEPHTSVLVSMPSLFLLTCLGVYGAVRQSRRGEWRPALLVAPLIAGSVCPLIVAGISERYAHDLFPLIAVCACVGMSLVAGTGGRLRSVTEGALGLLSVWAALVMIALTFVYQRDLVWGVPPERRAQMQTWSLVITELIRGTDLSPIHTRLEAGLTAMAGRPVNVGALRIALRAGSVELENLSIADDPAYSPGPLLQAASLQMSFELTPLLLHRKLNITSLRIDRPSLTLLQSPSGGWNFSSMVPRAEELATQLLGPGGPAPLSAQSIRIVGGRLLFGVVQSQAPVLLLDNVNLELHNVAAGAEVSFQASAILGGGRLTLEGKAGPIGPAKLAITPILVNLQLAGAELGASGLAPAGRPMNGLISVDARGDSTGQTARLTGRVRAGQLALANLRPALRPFTFDFEILHDLRTRAGRLSRGNLRFDRTQTVLTGTYDLSQGSVSLETFVNGPPRAAGDLDGFIAAINALAPGRFELVTRRN